jgi:1-acylglycerone phosphate reductase
MDRVLAPDSIYQPLAQEYVRRTKHSQEVGMATEKYARDVVSQVLGRSRRFIWAGFGANLVWFASTFLPAFVMVRSAKIAFRDSSS